MRNGKKVKLVIDVNVWISSLISPNFYRRVKAILLSDAELLFSVDLFKELNNSARKTKLYKYFDEADVDELMLVLFDKVVIVATHSVVEICRDSKDNYLLALAQDGNADYLITGDDDLLSLKQYGKTKIVKIADFELLR